MKLKIIWKAQRKCGNFECLFLQFYCKTDCWANYLENNFCWDNVRNDDSFP